MLQLASKQGESLLCARRLLVEMDGESEGRYDSLLLTIAQQHSGIEDVSYRVTKNPLSPDWPGRMHNEVPRMTVARHTLIYTRQLGTTRAR